MSRSASVLSLVIAAVVAAVSAAAALAAGKDDGFKTSRPAMLTAVKSGVVITPLLTVGDTLGNGYRFEAIPDGISVDTEKKKVDLFVNHETAKVPFPYVTAGPTAANSENDFDNAQVSHLVLNGQTAGVLDGSFVIPSSAGYQRFCSNFLATKEQGFDRDVLFTNEETPDDVLRQQASWPPALADPAQKEAGVVVALDMKTGSSNPIYGMGRLNHENAVAIPGYEENVVFTGDDTFTSGPLFQSGTPPTQTNVPGLGNVPSQSQLYSYIAKDTKSLLADEGDLWAFVSDTPGVKNYYDVTPGSGKVVTGHFIKVPKDIATGHKADGSELKAADKGYPLPPTNGSWQTDLRTSPAVGIDGPQWVLEYWSDLNNVFQFVRIEDIAYEKRGGKENRNVVYIVDSGRGRTEAQSLDTPNFKSTNGRVWKMVLDKNDPTKVTSLTVFVEGDDNPVKTVGEVHQPDNIESTKDGILLEEDPGSSQQFTAAEQVSDAARATTARIWFVPFADNGSAGTPEIVAKVDQSSDGTAGYDVDGRPNGNWGAWESSGIVDASKAFGKGAFLVNVQAHTLWVEKANGPDLVAPAGPDWTFKREGGQLLLLRLPTADGGKHDGNDDQGNQHGDEGDDHGNKNDRGDRDHGKKHGHGDRDHGKKDGHGDRDHGHGDD